MRGKIEKSKANELQSNQDFLGFLVARGDAGRGHFEFSLASGTIFLACDFTFGGPTTETFGDPFFHLIITIKTNGRS